MRNYCIFEIDRVTKKYKFVDNYGENYTAADEMCQAMNNFRNKDSTFYFCVRCLDQYELVNIKNYNPFFRSISLTK